jgi:hypothetical protein
METRNKSEGKESINVKSDDFLELLLIIDWMADWINNVGKRDYGNGVRAVNEKVDTIRKKYL